MNGWLIFAAVLGLLLGLLVVVDRALKGAGRIFPNFGTVLIGIGTVLFGLLAFSMVQFYMSLSDEDSDASAPATTAAIVDLEGSDDTGSGQLGSRVGDDDGQATDASDAESLSPNEGEWEITNLLGVVDCGAMQMPLADMETQRGTITVLDDGERILADGFQEGTADLLLERTNSSSSTVTYSGEVDIAAMGGDVPTEDVGDFTLAFTMVFDSPAHVTAEMTGTIEVAGLSCEVMRPADGSLTRAADDDAAVARAVAIEAPPIPVNCDPADATPNQITTVDDPIAAATPFAALEAFLSGPGPHPDITSGFTEIRQPDGTISYGAFTDDTLTVVIRVSGVAGDYAVTGWETSTC